MATIEDVAKRAGVSRMTVSRVINNTGYIKQETKERVLDAIEDLKYRPNRVAKMLVTRVNRTIAHVMVNISDPFHNMVNQGFESVAFRSQYTTMMCDAHSPSRANDYINLFLENRMGGVVFHHLAITAEQVQELEEGGVHCVLMDNEQDIPDVSAVNTDNRAGGAMAAEYLVSKGHRRIACVHGVLSRPEGDDIPYEDTFQFRLWQERTQGFTEAMRRLGVEPAGYFQSNGLFQSAERLAGGIVDELLGAENRATAIYCENDIIAVSILNELQKRGMRVPEDFAVVGHDGLDLCRMRHPHITTIAQPRYEMGRAAAELLIGHIEKRRDKETVVLMPKLVIGGTA